MTQKELATGMASLSRSCVILLLLAAIAAYLEYSVYPAIMTQSFGETGLSLQLSVLTFRWNAVSCISGNCKQIPGVQALDFFQIFVLALVLVNLSHYLGQRKRRAGGFTSASMSKEATSTNSEKDKRLLSRKLQCKWPCLRRRSTSHAQWLLRQSF